MSRKEKSFLIFLITGILVFILIVFAGVGVYSLCFNADDNENTVASTEKKVKKVKKASENKDNNEEKKEINQVLEQTVSRSDTEETLNVNSNDNNNSKKVTQYTLSNGDTYETVGTVYVPSLGIKYPILSEYTEALMKISVVKYWGSYPNDVGNLCILGHNYKNSKFFSDLPNIENGATVQITDASGRTVDYTVYETGVIDPEDTECTSQLTNGHTEVTLITCYYENGEAHASKRFYAKARAY